jgi:MoaA/NifB/PqqE/SkfB family radical SAM enzyme
MSTALPRRVVFNFVAQCNMACSFCYVPFDGRKADAATALAVLHSALRWNPEAFVFGGGDPLVYPYTCQLLAQTKARSSRTFVQLDTNAHLTSGQQLLAAARNVDLVGLPIDGLSRSVSNAMRAVASHGERALELVRLLARSGCAVKVNTVVSRANAHEIDRIGTAVASSGARIWSLYQFWPIGDIAVRNAEQHRISLVDYLATVDRQRQNFGQGVAIESSGSITERSGAYFFLSPTGRAFCTTESGDAFIEMGNVLDDEDQVLAIWRKHTDAAKNATRHVDRRRIAVLPAH